MEQEKNVLNRKESLREISLFIKNGVNEEELLLLLNKSDLSKNDKNSLYFLIKEYNVNYINRILKTMINSELFNCLLIREDYDVLFDLIFKKSILLLNEEMWDLLVDTHNFMSFETQDFLNFNILSEIIFALGYVKENKFNHKYSMEELKMFVSLMYNLRGNLEEDLKEAFYVLFNFKENLLENLLKTENHNIIVALFNENIIKSESLTLSILNSLIETDDTKSIENAVKKLYMNKE